MEAGNLLFGHSRGNFAVPREDAWSAPLGILFAVLGVDGYGHPGHLGADLEVRPYYWGDCECGFQERWDVNDAVWCQENQHREECYQVELRTKESEYDRTSGYAELERAAYGDRETHVGPLMAGMVSEITDHGNGARSMMLTPRRDADMQRFWAAHKRKDRWMERLYHRLGKKYGVDPHYGRAVHCTCDYETKRRAWCATDDHDAACRIVAPNLRWKPTGFELRWYKYPLRDAYMSHDLSLPEWTALFGQIIDAETARRVPNA